MALEQIVSNLASNTRRETLNGREYLVAPITLLVPGIHNGSQGSVYYSQDELEKDPSPWNGMPLVVNHPQTEDGSYISARNPDILNQVGIGQIFNATANGKLSAEAWFDVEKTRQVDPSILNRLENNEKIETSTGLGARLVEVENGTFQDKPYTAQATKFVPDHVAILPDSVGACSIKDGCGVLANEDKKTFINELTTALKDFFVSKDTEPNKKETNMNKETLINELIANCGCYSEQDKEVLNDYSEEKLKELHTHSVETKQNEVIANSVKQGFEDELGNKHIFNDKTNKFETTQAKKEEVEIVENMSIEVKDLAPELQEKWQEMERVFNEKKKSIIESLVVNIEDESEKVAKVEYLSNKTIEDLETIASFLPKQEEPQVVTNAYMGASGGAVTYVENSDDHDYDDVLEVATW